jgi:AraC-like DNA-binding protein
MTASLVPTLERRPDRRPDHVEHRRLPAFGGIDMVHATYTAHAFSPHLHEVFAMGVITRGANKLACRGATHVVRTGQMVVIEPGEIHTGEPVGKTGWTYRMLYPAADVVRAAAGRDETTGDTPHFRSTLIDDPRCADEFVRLHHQLESSSSELEQESRILTFLRGFVATHAGGCAEPPPGRDHRAIAIVRDYLHAHYNRPVRLATLAELTDLSPFHLIRVFRAGVGLPPYSYLEQVRIARAQAMLSRGVSVSRVAFATGFSDQSHLTRHFKRIVGMTPGQYMRGALTR